jgi:Replication-relaxation
MTDEPLRPEGKRQRSRQLKPIRLQERDLDICVSLSIARYLSVLAIEWLHYNEWEGKRKGETIKGGWRERYKAYLDQRKADPSAVYYPAPNIYHRLAALRAGPEPLVRRVARSVERASLVFNRLPDAYALTEAGAALLCARRGFDLASLYYEDPRRRSIQNLEHSIAIGTFYAALRAALGFSGQQFDGWRGDHLLAGRDPERGGSNYDRVAVPGLREEQSVLPDATFALAGQRYFVEIDMGTTNLRSWSEKVRAYEVYRRSPKLTARYTTDSFTVLVVAPSEVRLRRIAAEVLKATRQASTGYLFLTEDRVHPTTIRPAWKVVQTFAWERRKVVDRLVDFPAGLVFAGHPLWKTQREP